MIEFTCSNCGKSLQVSDQYAGKQARCPGCAQVVTVPDASSKPRAPERAEEVPRAQSTSPPYRTPPKPEKKIEEAGEPALGDEYMPSPEDPPDEECRHFSMLKMACGVGGIIAGIFCIVAGGIAWSTTAKGGIGAAAFVIGLIAAFFCAVFAGTGWVLFSYLAKIAVYLYSIDKRLKGK
jgi:hypothetical protein